MKNRYYNVLDEIFDENTRSLYEAKTVEVRASLRVADLLHQAMEEDGLNQKALSERLGVTTGYVSRLLSGDENPSVRKVARMLHLLGRSYLQNAGFRAGNFDMIIGRGADQKTELKATDLNLSLWFESSKQKENRSKFEIRRGA